MRGVAACLAFALAVLAWPAFSLAASAEARQVVTVGVASSYLARAQAVVAYFEAHVGRQVRVRLSPGSSGRLFNQIAHGAPFDVFISADPAMAARLARGGRRMARVGEGWLGLRIGGRMATDPRLLLDDGIRRVAIANPEVAPFGRAARELLQARGLWRALAPKLVRAQNALQARMLVDRGLVDAGLVPASPGEPHLPSPEARIEYRAVLLRDRPAARAFFETLADSLAGASRQAGG